MRCVEQEGCVWQEHLPIPPTSFHILFLLIRIFCDTCLHFHFHFIFLPYFCVGSNWDSLSCQLLVKNVKRYLDKILPQDVAVHFLFECGLHLLCPVFLHFILSCFCTNLCSVLPHVLQFSSIIVLFPVLLPIFWPLMYVYKVSDPNVCLFSRLTEMLSFLIFYVSLFFASIFPPDRDPPQFAHSLCSPPLFWPFFYIMDEGLLTAGTTYDVTAKNEDYVRGGSRSALFHLLIFRRNVSFNCSFPP